MQKNAHTPLTILFFHRFFKKKSENKEKKTLFSRKILQVLTIFSGLRLVFLPL